MSSDRLQAVYRNLPDDVKERFGSLIDAMSAFMIFTDPPRHARLKSLVNKAFTPRIVENMRARIQELVNGEHYLILTVTG